MLCVPFTSTIKYNKTNSNWRDLSFVKIVFFHLGNITLRFDLR